MVVRAAVMFGDVEVEVEGVESFSGESDQRLCTCAEAGGWRYRTKEDEGRCDGGGGWDRRRWRQMIRCGSDGLSKNVSSTELLTKSLKSEFLLMRRATSHF